MSKSLKSRISQILDRAEDGIPDALNASTKRIAASARVFVAVDQGDLKATIRTAGSGMSQKVLAGSRRVFWGHWIEWGGAHNAARPFMGRAAEQERASGQLEREIRDLYA